MCLLNNAACVWQAVAALGGKAGGERNDAIFLAAALRVDALCRLEAACAQGPMGGLALLQEGTVAVWAPARKEVLGRRRVQLGCLVLQVMSTHIPTNVFCCIGFSTSGCLSGSA